MRCTQLYTIIVGTKCCVVQFWFCGLYGWILQTCFWPHQLPWLDGVAFATSRPRLYHLNKLWFTGLKRQDVACYVSQQTLGAKMKMTYGTLRTWWLSLVSPVAFSSIAVPEPTTTASSTPSKVTSVAAANLTKVNQRSRQERWKPEPFSASMDLARRKSVYCSHRIVFWKMSNQSVNRTTKGPVNSIPSVSSNL